MVETCCNSDGTQLPALRARLREAREGTGEVLHVLQNAGFQIFVKGFTTLIVTCGRMGSWVKALEIFESMKSLGVEPNSYTYGALISVCYSAKQWERALELFYKMQEAGCAVDQLVFKHILPVCIKLGKFDLVLEFYKAMQQKAIELEVHTASAVLIACMRRRQWALAADMLDRYHATGKVLSHRLYTQLIGACADHGDVDEAVEFFLMMQLVGVLPNSYSCQNMMRAIESAGEIDLGTDLWEQMRQARIFVSCETYNSLARLFARGHKWSKFLDVLSEMVHVGVDISVDSEEVIKRCYAEHTESSSLSASIAWKLKNLGIPVDLEAQDWMIKANMHSPAVSRQPWAAPYVRVA